MLSELTTHKAEAAETPQVVSIDALIHTTALKYHLNEQHLRAVIDCESDFVVDAVGDGGASIGLAQIHLPSHPEISREQAEDPAFAIDFMGKMWANGEEEAWSCYRIEKARGWK